MPLANYTRRNQLRFRRCTLIFFLSSILCVLVLRLFFGEWPGNANRSLHDVFYENGMDGTKATHIVGQAQMRGKTDEEGERREWTASCRNSRTTADARYIKFRDSSFIKSIALAAGFVIGAAFYFCMFVFIDVAAILYEPSNVQSRFWSTLYQLSPGITEHFRIGVD